MVNRRTMSGQRDGSKNGHKIRIDDKKGSRSVTNKGKRSKGTKRGASSGRKSADGLTEDIDDAGSDSMMTCQPGQSDGGGGGRARTPWTGRRRRRRRAGNERKQEGCFVTERAPHQEAEERAAQARSKGPICG